MSTITVSTLYLKPTLFWWLLGGDSFGWNANTNTVQKQKMHIVIFNNIFKRIYVFWIDPQDVEHTFFLS